MPTDILRTFRKSEEYTLDKSIPFYMVRDKIPNRSSIIRGPAGLHSVKTSIGTSEILDP